jgi:Tn7-like transposition protein D/TniQ
MIASFWDPNPDELLYSAWARYGDRVRYPYKTKVVQELFGSIKTRPSIDLPCYIKYFLDKLPPGHGFTADFFIDHHTLLPFYGAFFSSERLKSIKEQMNSSNPAGLHYSCGISRGIPISSWLRYCPGCVEEDRARFGECYWHRLHQVPGVELCPIHSFLLEQSLLPMRGSENGYGLVSAEKAIQLAPPRSAGSSPFFKVFLDTAKEISYLLEHPFIFRDHHLFPQRYRTLLAQHGFITPKGLIRMDDFVKFFTEYYSQELLSTIHWGIKILAVPKHTTIARLFYSKGRVYHPLYHIMVIHSLDSTLERFLRQDHTLPSLFGNGPWPCLNPVCEYFQQRRILTYRTKEVSVKGKVTGEFTCTCGYTYVRTGPDLSSDDIFLKGKVLSYGPVWEAKLKELWCDKQVSLKSLAQQLGVHPQTATIHAGLLGLAPRRDYPNAFLDKTPRVNNQRDRSWYRTQWLSILEEAKDEPLRVVLRGRAKGIYSWLVRRDRDWLAAHRPIPQMWRKISTNPARVDQRYTDYTRLDLLMGEAIRAAANKLINLPGRPIRVSRNKITVEVPEVRRLRDREKMPLATQALQEVVETYESFAQRRIHWALERYVEEHGCPASWKFLRRAGIKAHILQIQNVQKAFDSAMNILLQFA